MDKQLADRKAKQEKEQEENKEKANKKVAEEEQKIKDKLAEKGIDPEVLNDPDKLHDLIKNDPEKQQMLKDIGVVIDQGATRDNPVSRFFGEMTDEIKNSIGNLGANSENIYKDELGNSHYRTCFVKGTLVETLNGAKAIEQLKIGEIALTRNEKTGKMEYKPITQLFENKVELLFDVEVGNTTLQTTWNHPFWVVTGSTGSPTGKWTEVKDLKIGDIVSLKDGSEAPITKIRQYNVAPTKVYNIEVEDNHNYFVGGSGVWVHNYPGEKIVNAAKNFISEKVEEAKDWVAGQKNYGKSIDYNDGKTDWRDSLEDIEKPRFARHDSDKEHTYRAVTLEQDGKKVSIIVRSSADIENLNEKSVKAFAKTAFETKGLNSVMINSGYRTGKDAGVHDQASYLDIRYLNHTRLNNGSNGNPGNQNIAQPEIYGNFKEAHSNNSSKQFLGPWSQSSKGRDWNWGDKPKAKTDAKHWHHGHIGY